MKTQYRYKGLADARSDNGQRTHAFVELGRDFLLSLLFEQQSDEKWIDWEYYIERAQTLGLLTEKKEADGSLVYVPTELSQLEEWNSGI